ncbi:MAG: prepilin-type N-terminal cleavage/methylation domain-containing protein [Armatimonadota bacterium]
MQQRGGFTLIELLVVIAIIAILAAILFPVFARARDKARQTSCLSNVKQISLGLIMYVQDYDETMPGFKIYYRPDSNSRGDGWYESIEPYVKNEQIGVCPSGKYTSTYGRSNMPNESGYWGRELVASYGVPAQDSTCRSVLGNLGTCFSSYYPPGPPIAKATKPSETVMIFESTTNWTQQTSGYGRDNSGNLRSISADGIRGVQHFRHSMQMNVGYLDGHAKSQGPGYMADLDVYRMVK